MTPNQYYGQIIHNENPTLMKKLMEKSSQEQVSDDFSPYMQLLATDDDRLAELRLKKATIFEKIRAKFIKPKPIDQTEVYGNKKTKIIEYYYSIPEKIAEKTQQLESLSRGDFKQRRQIKSEIRELKAKRETYHKSILKWYFPVNETNRPPEIQAKWEEFYLGHEQEMLEWMEYKKATMRPNLSEEEKTAFLESFCDDYFRATNALPRFSEVLRSDVRNNLEVIRTVYSKDFRDSSLPEILQEVRSSMDGKMLPHGMDKYRKSDIHSGIGDSFFIMSSGAEAINTDMQELASEYENLKAIEGKNEYIDKAVGIFQRFIQIHPYIDGNGRTSRALLDIMLINRGITPPVLYETYYDRGTLDEMSMGYLANNNPEPLLNYIRERVAVEQPSSSDCSQNEKLQDKQVDGNFEK